MMEQLLEQIASGAADLYIRAASLIIGPVLGLVVYGLAWIGGEPR
jgi:uncharacterized protein (DUF1501 family)